LHRRSATPRTCLTISRATGSSGGGRTNARSSGPSWTAARMHTAAMKPISGRTPTSATDGFDRPVRPCVNSGATGSGSAGVT